jgi:hypothetical protein
LRSIELPIVILPNARTWRASCRCLMTGNLATDYPEQGLVGFGVN